MNPTKDKLANAFAYGYASDKSIGLGHAPIKKQGQKKPLPRKKPHSMNAHTAYQTRTTCINTTALCAKGMGAGHYLAAAENQSHLARLWLRFVYDPSLDIYPEKKESIKRQLLVASYGVWCFTPKGHLPKPKNLAALGVLFVCVLDDAVATARNGLPVKTTTSTDKCQKMGYGVGKAAYQKADYSRQYRPFERDIMSLFQRLDDLAIQPVERMERAR